MAAAANRFLDSLISGTVPEHPASIGAMERPEAVGGIVSSEEEQVLLDTNIWVTARGLPGGELGYELVDENTGELRATLDLAWPEGVQEGYSLPVALLIDEGSEVERMANQSGFRSFTSADDFKSYVCSEILGLSTIQN